MAIKWVKEINVIDRTLAVSGGTLQCQEQFRLNTNDYSGTVSCYIEVVATSGDASTTVDIYNNNHVYYEDTITLSPTSATPIRYREAYSPNDTYPDKYLEYIDGTTNVYACRIIIVQSHATAITATETQVEIGSYQYGFYGATFGAPTYPKIWQFTSDNWDGTCTWYAEAVWVSNNNKYDTTIKLQYSTDQSTWYDELTIVNAQANETVQRTRVSWSGGPDDGYYYRLYLGCTGTKEEYGANLYAAKIICVQTSATAITKTESVRLLANSYQSSAGLLNYDQYYDPDEFDGVDISSYHEATQYAAGSSDLAKLQEDPNGTPSDISGSTISGTGSGNKLSRSSAMTMPGTAETVDTYLLNQSLNMSCIVHVIKGGVIAGSTIHDYSTDKISLTQLHELVVNGANHNSTSTKTSIILKFFISSVVNTEHQQITDSGFILLQSHFLDQSNTTHTHSSDIASIILKFDLVVANCTHRHFNGEGWFITGWFEDPGWLADLTLEISTKVSLAIVNCIHATTSQSVTLTQVHILAVQSPSHGHITDKLSVFTITDLVTDNTLHSHTTESPTLIVGLSVDNTTHQHVTDKVALTQSISVDNTTHSHSTTLVILVVGLSVYDATHSHVVDSATLTQLHILTLDNTLHSSLTDEISLIQLHSLVLSSTTHSHTVDSIGLTQYHILAVANCLHSSIADHSVLAQLHYLDIGNCLHTHTVNHLSIAAELNVSNCIHSHTTDNIELIAAINLIVGDGLHQHQTDSIQLEQIYFLTVDNAIHSHTTDDISLTQLHVLAPRNALHSHITDDIILAQTHSLTLQNCLHSHITTSPVLVSITGGLTDYAELKVLDHILKVESYSVPTTVYLAISLADPTEDASGLSEPTGGGYERQPLVFGAASSRSIAQSATISFNQATASLGTVTHWAVMDSKTSGNAMAYGSLASSAQILSGEIPQIAIGEIQISVHSGGFFTSYVNDILDWLFRNQSLAVPENIYIAASTTLPNDAGNVTEPSVGGYGRAQHNSWVTASGGASYNLGTISFTQSTASWGTIVGLVAYTSSTGGTGIFYGLVTSTLMPSDTELQLLEGNYDIYVD